MEASGDGAGVSERTPLLPAEQAGAVATPKEDQLKVPSARFVLVAAAYACTLFLMTANGTALTTIYGSVADSLDAYENAATWLNASYMIATSCANPIIGRLTTLFKPTSVFMTCTAFFALGCLISGLAATEGIFIVGRVLTGAGGGGILTTATVLLVEVAPVKKRGLLLGIVNAVVTCGTSLGGVISGAFIGSGRGWRPVFLLQVPLLASAIIIIFFLSPHPSPELGELELRKRLRKMDYLGVLTLCATLILLLWTAMAPSFSLIPFLLGCATFAAFVLVESKVAKLPLIPMSVLLHPATLLGCISIMLTMTARWTVLFFAPIWSIAVLGYHPAKAGASLIPASTGLAVGSLLVGGFSIRHAGGYYWQTMATVVVLGSSYLIFLLLPQGNAVIVDALLLLLNGLATGSKVTYSLAHILSDTQEKPVATSLYTTFRGLAPSIGAGLAGGILQRKLNSSLQASFSAHHPHHPLDKADRILIQRLKGSPALVWQLEGWQRAAGILAYTTAIKGVFTLSLILCGLALVAQALTAVKAPRSNGSKEVKHPLSPEDSLEVDTV